MIDFAIVLTMYCAITVSRFSIFQTFTYCYFQDVKILISWKIFKGKSLLILFTIVLNNRRQILSAAAISEIACAIDTERTMVLIICLTSVIKRKKFKQF